MSRNIINIQEITEMAWERLDIDDLRLTLAEDEVQKLNTCSLDENLSGVIQQQLDMAADAFRGAWQSAGYNIDVRDHYVAPQYKQFVLDYARWAIWTRFPMTEGYALSEPRQKQYEFALKLLEKPFLGVEKPDYSDDPDLSGNTDLTATHDAAITLPWQKFPSMPFEYGFFDVYPFPKFEKK